MELTSRRTQNQPMSIMTAPQKRATTPIPLEEQREGVGVGAPLDQAHHEGEAMRMRADRRPRREREHVTLHALTLPDRQAHLAEGLGEVPARVPVDVDGANHPLEINVVHAQGERPQRLREVTPQTIGQHVGELAPRRFLRSSATESRAWAMPYPLRSEVVTSWSRSGT